jgi:hypothetical protein
MSITVQAFLLCNSVERAPNKPTMLAMFDILLAARLPATRKCALFCRLFAGDQRQHEISLLMETPALVTHQLLAPRKFAPNPNGIIQLTREIGRLELAHEGIYTFKLGVDRKPQSEFHLTVSYKSIADKTSIADRDYGFTIEQPSAKRGE